MQVKYIKGLRFILNSTCVRFCLSESSFIYSSVFTCPIKRVKQFQFVISAVSGAEACRIRVFEKRKICASRWNRTMPESVKFLCFRLGNLVKIADKNVRILFNVTRFTARHKLANLCFAQT